MRNRLYALPSARPMPSHRPMFFSVFSAFGGVPKVPKVPKVLSPFRPFADAVPIADGKSGKTARGGPAKAGRAVIAAGRHG